MYTLQEVLDMIPDTAKSITGEQTVWHSNGMCDWTEPGKSFSKRSNPEKIKETITKKCKEVSNSACFNVTYLPDNCMFIEYGMRDWTFAINY